MYFFHLPNPTRPELKSLKFPFFRRHICNIAVPGVVCCLLTRGSPDTALGKDPEKRGFGEVDLTPYGKQ